MRFHLLTWGCQMNELDSDRMAGALRAAGMDPAGTPEDADVVLLNTCAIREKAADKVFSELGRLRRLKDGSDPPVIGLCGCVAQLEGERVFDRVPWLDFVMGPRGIGSLIQMVESARHRRRSIDVVHHQESVLFPWQLTQRNGGPRAYVTVVEGCNKACTFCVVPRTRGPEASRPLEDVIREVRSLASAGYREIEFLGQTVNAYKDPRARRLSDLLAAADAVAGVERIRFTTSHPVHMTSDLIQAMASLPRVCPHVHMPAQTGSDRILRRMKRGYTRSGYLGRVASLRQAVSGVEVSTDLIVGFPGETAEDFQQTLSLLDEVGFATVYGFVYSPRPGTEAAEMDGAVPRSVADERLASLLERQKQIQEARNRAWIGRQVEVLIDGPSKKDPMDWTGRTPENRVVNFRSPAQSPGDFVPVHVLAASAYSLRGEALP